MYRWIADQQDIEVILRLPASRRQHLLQQFDALADNPFQIGDAQMTDDSGRELQLKIIEPYIVTYWPDHAVKELRIVSIETV